MAAVAGVTFENTTRLIDTKDYRIQINEAGGGHPIFMIHGGGPGATGWSEVLRVHGLLRGRDALADHAGLDGDILFHAEPQHEFLHALAAEDPHQVVLERKIEARAARVALASGASAELIVDAAGLMPLRAEHV